MKIYIVVVYEQVAYAISAEESADVCLSTAILFCGVLILFRLQVRE